MLLNEFKLPSIYDNDRPKLFSSSLFLINPKNDTNHNNNKTPQISHSPTTTATTTTTTTTSTLINNNDSNDNNNINSPNLDSSSNSSGGANSFSSFNSSSISDGANSNFNNRNSISSTSINNIINKSSISNLIENNHEYNNNTNNINNNDNINNSFSKFTINNLYTPNNHYNNNSCSGTKLFISNTNFISNNNSYNSYNSENNNNDNSNKKSKKSNIKKKDPFNIYQVSNSFCLEVCGVSYDTLIFLWTFIKNNNPPFEANSYQLVWALNWLKDYSQVREGASKWSVGKDLFQKAINNIITFLGSELNTISLNERHIGTNNNSKTKLVIDILFVETQKPSDKETQNLLFSKKHQKYGYKFECCVRSNDGLICWFKGPYPGSAQLLSILDSSRLLQSVDEDEKILAKSDYIGISKKFEFPLKASHLDKLNIDELLNYEQQITYCQILDNTISFMKKFRFCCDRIRTKGSILEYGIRLIANIHNLELENKPPIQCLKKKKLFI